MNRPNHRQYNGESERGQQQIRVLHVDDDPEFTGLAQRWFEQTHADMAVVTESDPTRVLGQLEHGPSVDAVVSDYRMPDVNGLELLEEIRADHPDVPFVMVTGEGSEAIASEAIHAGVTDYFTKGEVADNFSLLVERVRSLALQQRAARESQRFGTLLEILNVPVTVLDNKGRVTASNALFGELIDAAGYDRNAPPRLEALVNEADRHSFTGYVEQLHDTAGPDLLSMQLAVPAGNDSVTYRAQMAAVPGIETARTGILVVLEPTTDDRNQFRATLSDLVEWATGPYITVDDDWHVTVVNQNAQELFGEEERSIIGHSLWEFFPAFEDATFHDQLRAVKRHGTPLDAEVYYAPTGMHFHVRAYRTSTGVAVYLQDITERVERESELERLAERFQEFAKIVAHDLRNPISTAKGYAGIVAESGCEDEDAIRVVEQSLDRADAIITQTLTFAEEGRVGSIEAVDLEAAVEEAWRDVEGAWRDVEGAWEGVEPSESTVEVEATVALQADPNGLTRILGNLLRNCVEHGSTSSQPGAIDGVDDGATAGRPDGEQGSTADAAATDGVTAVVGALPSSDTTVGFYLEDDGPGIPPETRDVVFETRYSTSETGTGFGLAVVEQIAVAHGWSVRVTEGTKGGARFEFTGIDPADEAASMGGGSTTVQADGEGDDD